MPKEIVDVQEFHQRLEITSEQGSDVLRIDVREAGEFEAYHVPGARLFPLSTFDAADTLAELGLNTADSNPLYVLCQVGGRAMQACELLEAAGYSHTVLVDGGTLGWANAGYDLAAGAD